LQVKWIYNRSIISDLQMSYSMSNYSEAA